MRYDLAITGSGGAAFAAAITARDAGASVVMIERGTMPARPADIFATANIRMHGDYSIRLGKYVNMMSGGGGPHG